MLPRAEMPWSTGDELRVARTRKGLKGEELAEIIGVTAKTIYRWENPKNAAEPSISQWRAIARACDAPWLLSPTADNAPFDNADGPVIVNKDQDMIPGFPLPPTRDSPSLALV